VDVEPFRVDFDGGVVEGLRAGASERDALVFHNGTPTAAALLPDVVAAAERHGLQVLTWSRPGYAGSTARPGRTVADNAAITAAVLAAFGAPSFVTAGWSGGGPHALADVALSASCRAAATIAGVAPYDAPIDWLAGMAPENVEEFGLAASGEEPLRAFLEQFGDVLREVDGSMMAESLGELASDVDKAALTGEFADHMAAMMRGAVSTGIAGWLADDLAFVGDWGFAPASITQPVAVWQGDNDRMVPFAHGEWLAANVKNAVPHLLPGEGHITLGAQRIGEILDDLVALGA
jgi:pimeloyl-ACP methyl ester carboxylesterase